jgi:hypothetical protein
MMFGGVMRLTWVAQVDSISGKLHVKFAVNWRHCH